MEEKLFNFGYAIQLVNSINKYGEKLFKRQLKKY